MARYFAKINNENIVEQVIVSDSKTWINNNLEGEWVETFINSKNKEYAGIGYSYDRASKDFYPPQPFPSWSLDSDLQWEAPVPYPQDGLIYKWDEENTSWVKIKI